MRRAIVTLLTLLLLAALAFVAAATRWIIPATERRLARSFGGWWRDYAASTPRWM